MCVRECASLSVSVHADECTECSECGLYSGCQLSIDIGCGNLEKHMLASEHADVIS